MSLEYDLTRYLTFSSKVAESAEELEKIANPLEHKTGLIDSRKAYMSEDSAMFDHLSFDTSLIIEDLDDFKEMFAHHSCVLFAAALWEADFVSDIHAFMSSDGEPLHYYCSGELNGKTYFFDAYGVFSDESELVGRYQREGHCEKLDMEGDDSHNAFRNYRDFEAGVLDEMPGEDCGEQVEYLEVYYESLLLTWAKGLDDTALGLQPSMTM